MPSDNMRLRSRFFVIVLIGLLNCKSTNEPGDKIINSDAETSDRLINSETFGVEAIDVNAESEQIRVWYFHSFLHFVYVVSLKKTSGQWTATQTTSIRDIEVDSLVIKEVKTRVLIPKSGWKIFMDNLSALNIHELPDMNEIPKLRDGMFDGSQFLVEIGRKDYYRSYGYHGPNHFEDEFVEAKNMTDILRLIDDELDVPWKTGNSRWYEFVDRELK